MIQCYVRQQPSLIVSVMNTSHCLVILHFFHFHPLSCHSAALVARQGRGGDPPAFRHLSRASPTDYAFGWITFWVSIFLIGIVTAFIGDIASHLGCTIGLKDSVNAIAFVALGTSVPGNLASERSCYALGGLPLTWCNPSCIRANFPSRLYLVSLDRFITQSQRPASMG